MRRGVERIVGGLTATAALAAVLLLAPAVARAQERSSEQPAGTANGVETAAAPAPAAESAKPAAAEKAAAPVFDDYKGVRLGMGAEEVRKALGHLREKGKEQDFFDFSDGETAQVFYDASGKVTAIAVSYYDGKRPAPTPAEVFGKEVAPREDGSLYQLERYPEAGYWVSYNRTAGDAPIVTITMNKMR